MPEQFRFEATAPLITGAFTQAEINDVPPQNWQTSTRDFLFEFHTMHPLGWPCYLREPNGPPDGLPKMNVRTESWTGEVLAGKSVRNLANGADFKRVVTANVAMFRRLAERFYIGVEEVKPPSVRTWYVRFQCTKVATAKPNHGRLPVNGQAVGAHYWANMRTIANGLGKPPCPVHKNGLCMDQGTAVALTEAEAVGITLQYDANFDLVKI
ncbi:MAG: hypothetical protein MUF73_18955 [Rhodobacteraceae bacterium]|jgi:hypothetical protein|nr:hypothetical protein [Paracoccaceae bacterium]